jgi:hypothetical protein
MSLPSWRYRSWRLDLQMEHELTICVVTLSVRSLVHRSRASIVSMGGMGSGWRRVPCCGNLDAWKHSTNFGGHCWTRVAMAKGCGILGWFGTRDVIDGWQIEARSAVRSVFESSKQSGLVLPFFTELDFLFSSGALVGYGVSVLEWLASRPCLVWRGHCNLCPASYSRSLVLSGGCISLFLCL